ncbi:MAG: hypothetical protein WC523_02055 [Patescibacteria group bacterium]|jgi:hypothetical protein
MKKIEIIVEVGNNGKKLIHKFIGTLHKAENINQLKLEPKEFYEAYSKLPEFPHFEIELNTDDTSEANPPVWEHEFFQKIHFHKLRSNKFFVCWTERLASEKEAINLFRVWCLGTTYTMIKNKDFAELFYLVRDQENFTRIMDQDHGIKIAEEKKERLN